MAKKSPEERKKQGYYSLKQYEEHYKKYMQRPENKARMQEHVSKYMSKENDKNQTIKDYQNITSSLINIIKRNQIGIKNIKEANKQSYSLNEIMDNAGVYIK